MNERLATIYFIGMGALVALGGAIVLLTQKDGVQTEFVALLGFAGTAIGLLAPSPLSKSSTATDLHGSPTRVEVVNAPGEPVLVEEDRG